MRTTLSLDNELAAKLADLARETHTSFKVVVNEAIRRGLSDSAPPEAVFRIQPHAGRLQPSIDDRGFNELAWETDRSPSNNDR